MRIPNQEKVWEDISWKWNKYKKRANQDVVDFLKGKTGRVLDLGCGSGRNLVRIKGLDWYCVDFSKQMLEYAKENANKKDMEISVSQSNSWELDFEDDFFDYIVCNAVLHCLTKKQQEKTIKEMKRVLKSNGKAFVSVWSKNSSRLRNKDKQCFVPWSVGKVSKNSKRSQKVMRYTYIFDKDELAEMFKQEGFEVAKVWEDVNVNLVVEKG